MRELLSYRDLRHLRLVEILNLQREMIQLKEISKMLDVPIRTIHSDIRNLNYYIAPFFILTTSAGVILEIPENYSIRYIYKKILENSLEFRLLQYVFLNEEKTIKELSKEFFISESTIKRLIKRINKILIKENIEISTSPVNMTGNERKITQFMSSYYNELYFQFDFVSVEERKLIEKLVQSVFDDEKIELHFNQLKKYTTWIYVNLVRMKNGHYADVVTNRFANASVLEDEDFCQKFSQVFTVELNEGNLNRILYARSRAGFISSYQELVKVNYDNKKQAELTKNVETVLNKITADLCIPFTSDARESLLLDIVNLINVRGYITFILYDKREYFLKRLSDNYRHVRELVQSYIDRLVVPPFDNIEINELTYILLTHLPDLFDRLRYIEKKVVIAILVDSDLEHAYFIKKELDSYSRFNIETKILMGFDLEQVHALTKKQILVTNIPGITNVACRVLCFADYFSSRNWSQLNEQITCILNA